MRRTLGRSRGGLAHFSPWALWALGLALAGCSATSMPGVHSEPERLELARRAMARRDYTVATELLKSS